MAGCTNNRCMWTGEKTKIFHHLINQKIFGFSTCQVLCCQGDYLFSAPLLLDFITLPILPWSNITSVVHKTHLIFCFFCLSLMETFKKFVSHWDGNQATVWLILNLLGNRVPPLNRSWKILGTKVSVFPNIHLQYTKVTVALYPKLWDRFSRGFRTQQGKSNTSISPQLPSRTRWFPQPSVVKWGYSPFSWVQHSSTRCAVQGYATSLSQGQH